jgi:AcrR family transcriptional regulator
MIDAIGENGYHATRVADVTARAGVSRKTFYELFSGKQDCFLATYDQISAAVVRRLEQAYHDADGWPSSAEAAICALFEAAIENPAAARLSLLEINAAGPAGIQRREESIARYQGFIRDVLRREPGGETVPDVVITTIVGGLIRVLYARVLRGQRAKILKLIPDLVDWIASYLPAPDLILAQQTGGEGPRSCSPLDGGHAPGTLAPRALLTKRRGLPRGDQNVSRSFVVHSQRERILDAVANLTAARGYAELTVEDIVEQAAVSLNSFYEHFADKEDAFLVAYEVGHSKGLAIVERAYFGESDWMQGVRAGISALFEFLATEPSFAHIALVDAAVATPLTAERSHVGVSAFTRMLVPGTDEAPGQGARSSVTIEAISGGLFELCLHCVAQAKIEELPQMTPSAAYVALAPFIGGEEAAGVAAASRDR